MNDIVKAITRLIRLGWVARSEIADLVSKPSFTAIIPIIKKFQEFHSIPQTGTLDPATVRVLEAPRMCGSPDFMMEDQASLPKWPHPHIHFRCDGSWPMPIEKVRGAFEFATREISRVCGATFEIVDQFPEDARSRGSAFCRVLDGQGGVLAQSELANNRDGLLTQIYDRSEAWDFAVQYGLTPGNKIDMGLVALHEMCHFMGVPHIGGTLAVMNPTYNPALKTLQVADIEALVKRYGLPKTDNGGPVQKVIITGRDIKIERV